MAVALIMGLAAALHSDPAINPDHNGVFVAITYGTAGAQLL
jgi:hypothetical protein